MIDKNVFKKFIEGRNKWIIFVISIIGAVLMVTSGGGEEKTKADGTAEYVYEELEKKLENILSDIEGAGAVSVMISYDSTSEKELAYETSTSRSSRDSGDSLASEESADKSAVMTDGAPTVLKESYPAVRGVIVTADGAGDPAVKAALSQSVAAVLDVPAHRVCVYRKK